MYNFDVVFLLLSASHSKYFETFWELCELAAHAGFHTTIATKPSDLAVSATRLRVIVVDGGELNDAEGQAILDELNLLREIRILYLTNPERNVDDNELAQVADMCLPLPGHFNKFRDALTHLSGESVSSEAEENAEHIAMNGGLLMPEGEELGLEKIGIESEGDDNSWMWLYR